MATDMLFAIRHGETDWNAEGRFQGHSDVALNEKGMRQARESGERLRARLADLSIAPAEMAFFCSPLARAEATMRILRRALGLAETGFASDERLREAGFGTWEGLTTHEVKQRFGLQRRLRKADRWNFAPPGGQSLAELEAKARSFLRERPPGTPATIVSHLGNLRVIFGLLQGLSREAAMALEVPHDRVLSWDGHCTGII